MTAILNASGSPVVSYTYDAWGKPLTVTGSLATTLGTHNPLRYRGYVYDTETELYYVSSRYYNPEIDRFISPDTIDIITATPMALTDKNLFAYCDNNPVIRVDHGGDFWMLIGAAVGAFISGAVSAISQYASTGEIDWKVVGVNCAAGAISGAFASTGIGLGASIGINAALGGGTYVAEQAIKGEDISLEGVVVSTIAGGIGGAIGGRGANAKGLSAAWKSASNSIVRESRRANVKYAAKQIAKYTAAKLTIKTSAKTAIGRLAFGAIGNTIARWEFGY